MAVNPALNNAMLGIDFGSSSIHMAQLDQGNVIKTAFERIPSSSNLSQDQIDQMLAETIKKLIIAHKFKKNSVSVSLPQGEVCVRTFTIPLMSQSETADAVKWQAKRYIAYPMEETVFNFSLLGEVQEGETRKQQIVLMAVLKKVYQRYLKIFQMAGLKVASVNTACFAVGNLLSASTSDSKAIVVADIGYSGMNLSFFKDNNLIFTRNASGGGSAFDEILKEKLGAGTTSEMINQVKTQTGILLEVSALMPTHIDALQYIAASQEYVNKLSKELQLTFSHYSQISRGEEAGRIILCGSGAQLKNLANALQSKTSYQVDVINAPAALTMTGPFSPYAVSFGLTLENGKNPNVIALQNQEKKRKLFEGQPLLKNIVIFYVIGVALCLAFFLGKNFVLNNQITKAKEELGSLQEKEVQLLSLQRQVSKLELRKKIYEKLSGEETFLPDILAKLSSIIPKDKIKLSNLSYDSLGPDGPKLMIQGQIVSSQNDNLSGELDMLISALKETKYFKKLIPVINENAALGSEGKTLTFSIECQFNIGT